MPESKQIPGQPPLKPERSDDFVSAYANNAAFEASAWDFKVIFGELDQGQGTIVQHTAITMPWSVTKLLFYHLNLQITAYETLNGRIPIQEGLKPDEVVSPPELIKDDPRIQKVYEAMKKVREEFIKSAFE